MRKTCIVLLMMFFPSFAAWGDNVIFDNFGVPSAGVGATSLGDLLLAQRFSTDPASNPDPWSSFNLFGTWFSSTIGGRYQMQVRTEDPPDAIDIQSIVLAMFRDESVNPSAGPADVWIYSDIFNPAGPGGEQFEPNGILAHFTTGPDLPNALMTDGGGNVVGGVTLSGLDTELSSGHYWVVLGSAAGDELDWSDETTTPEPATFGLAAVALAWLAARQRKRPA